MNLHKFVYEIQDMPYDEYVKWQKYFETRPIGWREDERTLKLLQIQGFKGEPSSIFSSFANMKKNEDPLGLKASPFSSFMKNAKGGDKVSLF